jgi:hypothetical protein
VIPEIDGSDLDAGASVSQMGSYLRRNHLNSALEPDATAVRTLHRGKGKTGVFILRVTLDRRSETMVTTLGAKKTRSEGNLRVEDEQGGTCTICDCEVDGVFAALHTQIECSILHPDIA